MGVYTDAILEDTGHEDTASFLDDYGLESMVPGVCKDKECLAVVDVEADQARGWCPVCEGTTVVSAMRLWGLI